MYAYPITQFGVDRLERVELPMLQIASGMVLIKVHAVSLNYRDLMMVKGFYNPKMALPRILVRTERGGRRDRGGRQTSEVGDRVCGIFMQRWLDGPLTAEKSKAALGGDVDGCSPSVSCWIRMGLSVFRSTLAMKRRRRSPARA